MEANLARDKPKKPEKAPLFDAGPKQREQHGDYVLEETMQAGVYRARNQTPFALDLYNKKKLLGDDKDDNRNNARRFDAGDRFRDDFTTADMDPDVVSGYSEWIPSGETTVWSTKKIDALRRWRKAVQKIGPIASSEVISVCCFGEAIGRDKMVILRRGLEVLAVHYGY